MFPHFHVSIFRWCLSRYHNPYNRRGTEAEMIAARMQVEPPELKTMREMASVKVRLKPLGQDRDRRRYWLLATGEVRIYL